LHGLLPRQFERLILIFNKHGIDIYPETVDDPHILHIAMQNLQGIAGMRQICVLSEPTKLPRMILLME